MRFSHLSEYYVHPDELMYLTIARGESLADVWRRGLQEMLPPFGHFLRYAYAYRIDSVFVHRLASIVPGLLCIPLSYRIGARTVGPMGGLVFAFAAAFSFGAVIFTVIVRNYGLYYLLLLSALDLFLTYREHPRARTLVAYVLAMTLASVTHFSGFIVLFVLGAIEGYRGVKHPERRRLALWIGCHIVPACAALILYLAYFGPGSYGRGWIDFFARRAPMLTLRNDGGVNDLVRLIHCYWGLIVPNFAAAALLATGFWPGLVALFFRNREVFVVVGGVFVTQVVLAHLQLYPFGGVRYCFYLIPFLTWPLAALAQAAIDTTRRLPEGTARALRAWFVGLFGAGAVVLVAAAIGRDVYFRRSNEFPLRSEDAAGAIDRIEESVPPSEVIVANKLTWLQLRYWHTAGAVMYEDTPHGEYVVAGRHLVYDGRAYAWEYFDVEVLQDVLARTLRGGRAGAKRIWFLVIGPSDFAILSLYQCLRGEGANDATWSTRGALLFAVDADVVRDRFLTPDADLSRCLEESAVPRMGALFDLSTRSLLVGDRPIR